MEDADYLIYIGTTVRKRSGSPFKSGYKTNTVRGLCTNLYTRELAFVFEEDDSFVNVRQIRLPDELLYFPLETTRAEIEARMRVVPMTKRKPLPFM